MLYNASSVLWFWKSQSIPSRSTDSTLSSTALSAQPRYPSTHETPRQHRRLAWIGVTAIDRWMRRFRFSDGQTNVQNFISLDPPPLSDRQEIESKIFCPVFPDLKKDKSWVFLPRTKSNSAPMCRTSPAASSGKFKFWEWPAAYLRACAQT